VHIAADNNSSDTSHALRHVFSTLAHLERVAINSCARGNGIPEQLADEIRHESIFTVLAQAHGGLLPTPPSVLELSDFFDSVSGPTAQVSLNVVSEIWLGVTLKFIRANVDERYHGQLDEVISDETRHAVSDVPSVNFEIEELVPAFRELERILLGITFDPFFVIPLAWLSGMSGVSRLGEKIIKRHSDICSRLGIPRNLLLDDYVVCGRSLRAKADEPSSVHLNAWQISAFRAHIPPIVAVVKVRPWGRLKNLEARVVRALSRVLYENPELNVTIQDTRQELWAPREPIVGVRRLYDRRSLVSTVYVKGAHKKSLRGVVSKLREATAMLRRLPYQAVPDTSGLERLLPPSRVAATVTNCSVQFPLGTFGFASLIPTEGATISVTISPRGFLGSVYLGVVVDHRAINGRELGLLVNGLKHGC